MSQNLKILLSFLVLQLFSLSALSQKLTVNQMQSDINYYIGTLKDLHPDLYKYYSPKQIDSVKNQLLASCSESLSVSEFNYLVAKTNKFTDETTKIDCPSVSLYSEKDRQNLFPGVEFREDRMYIKENRIETINGIPATDIIKDLDLLISQDIHPVRRQQMLNDYLSPVLFNIYHIHSPFVCSMQKKDSENRIDTVIQAVSEKGKVQDLPLSARRYTDSPIGYDYFPDDSIALLYYNTCRFWNESSFENSLDEFTKVFFQQIKELKIKYLFIDVTQQGEGNELYHKYITKYLRCKPYEKTIKSKTTSKGGLKLYEEAIGELAEGKNHEELTKQDLKQLAEKYPELKLLLSLKETGKSEWKIAGEDQPTGFDGKVFVLMGSNTHSAGYLFCESLKRANAAILIGEECGQRVPVGGNQISVKLPESGISCSIPLLVGDIIPALPNRDGFLLPDIPYSLDKLLGVDDYKNIIRLSSASK